MPADFGSQTGNASLLSILLSRQIITLYDIMVYSTCPLFSAHFFITTSASPVSRSDLRNNGIMAVPTWFNTSVSENFLDGNPIQYLPVVGGGTGLQLQCTSALWGLTVEDGMVRCRNSCPAGQRADWTVADGCTPCLPGSFQPGSGMSVCWYTQKCDDVSLVQGEVTLPTTSSDRQCGPCTNSRRDNCEAPQSH